MITAIAITLTIALALAHSLRGGRRGGLIAEHGYNNRYNDATRARRDWLG